MHFIGFGTHNDLLNELEELKQDAQLRANDLLRDDLARARAQATADAYGYCQLRIKALAGLRTGAPEQGGLPDR